MTTLFSNRVPDFSRAKDPHTFGSCLCREQHFHMPLYTYWCRALKEAPRFHRKQWEFVFICQSLYERGYLKEGLSALGFGVGREPLASLMASYGISVLATDLEFEKAAELGWVATDQHATAVGHLNEQGICSEDLFKKNVSYQSVNMNDIPSDIGSFDICWSSCAFEHLGSIQLGLDFVVNSSRLLKPGGIAVHTTEFNLTSNDHTLDNNPSFVIFRKKDIELLQERLVSEGFDVEVIDYSSGHDELESYIDLPPYVDEPHLRLELAGKYSSTSIGLIIRN